RSPDPESAVLRARPQYRTWLTLTGLNSTHADGPWHGFKQQTRPVQGRCGASLTINVPVYVLSIQLRYSEQFRQMGGRLSVVAAPQRDVHLFVRQGVVKLILTLGQAIGVRGGRCIANRVRQPHVAG